MTRRATRWVTPIALARPMPAFGWGTFWMVTLWVLVLLGQQVLARFGMTI